MCRAFSFHEKNHYLKSDDYIAPLLLPRILQFLLKFRLINIRWPIFPKGIYEYVIARTKYIDDKVISAMEEGIEQIVLPGAGYDTRAIRFSDSNPRVKFFELEVETTLTAKINQYNKRGIPRPGNSIFIPIDFMIETMDEKLLEYGFNPCKKSLFLLEGLIMYLDQAAVEDLLSRINQLTLPGSPIIFDYILASVLRNENALYGEKSIHRQVISANEAWQFGLEIGQAEAFLGKFGLKLIDLLDAEKLERLFFLNEQGSIIARINGTHGIIYAERQ